MVRARNLPSVYGVTIALAITVIVAGKPQVWGQDLPTADVRLRVDLAPIPFPASDGQGQNQDAARSTPPSDLTVSQAVWVESERERLRELAVQSANVTSQPSRPQQDTSVETATTFDSGIRSAVRSSLDKIPLEPPKAGASMADTKRTSGASFLSIVTSLMIVVGGFMGCVWIAKKLNSQMPRGIDPEAVSILGQLRVAPGQTLLVIRFGNKLILANQQNGTCQTLSEIDNAAEVTRISEICATHAQNTASPTFDLLRWTNLLAMHRGKRERLVREPLVPFGSVGGTIE